MNALDTVHRYHSLRLGVSLADLQAGQVAVATSPRRTIAERSYGFISLAWVLSIGDRAAVSVHPAALSDVSRLAWNVKPEDVLGDDFCGRARDAIGIALVISDLPVSGEDIALYHPGDATVVPTDGEVRPVTEADKQRWVGQRQFWHAGEHPSAERGEAFGVFIGNQLVADVITHDPTVAEMAHLVAEDGIEVSEGFRRQGYGKALLSFWTAEMQRRGRVCIHHAAAGNEASVALARSVGYLEYARSRFVTRRPG